MDEQITYGSKIAYNVYSRREVIAKRPLDLLMYSLRKYEVYLCERTKVVVELEFKFYVN